ncbi:MAG: hypothetical protein H0U57_01155 [Tatlockia sp.]|nr:hypothetical protein [Tatlockia sp.]
MEIAALIIFIITALLGIYLISYVMVKKNTPKGIAMIHGALGALAILFLALNVFTYPWIVLFFCLVALGGFILMILDITGKTLPIWLALGHGILGIVGILTLLYFII